MRSPDKLAGFRKRVLWGSFFLGLSGFVVGANTAVDSGGVRPEGLAVLYAVPSSYGEQAYLQTYSATGRSGPAPAINLGSLGLIGETSALVSRGLTWQATIGDQIDFGERHRLIARLAVASREPVLSLAWANSTLYALRQPVRGGPVWVEAVGSDRRLHGVRHLPSGLVSIWGSTVGPMATIIEPHSVSVTALAGGFRITTLRGVDAAFWIGFTRGWAVIPYSQGLRQFGIAWLGAGVTPRRTRFASASSAIVGVTNSSPLWGFGQAGVVPLHLGTFDRVQTRRWPGPMPTTITLTSGVGPWCLFFGGSGQGYWFNTRDGQFGSAFRIRVPAGAVIRQVAALTRA